MRLPVGPGGGLQNPPNPPPPLPGELTVPKADEVIMRSCPQDEVLQTPVTPVSAEALLSLQQFAIKKYTQTLDDETRKRNLMRHLDKFTKAAQTSFAKGALQQHQIRFLIKMNDESKVRRSVKSEILAKGEGKVMSYEDLDAARTERAEKEAAKAAKGKGKRGRKPKSVEGEVEDASADNVKRSRKRKSAAVEAGASERKAKVARMSEPSEPFMSPVTQMVAPVAQMMPR